MSSPREYPTRPWVGIGAIVLRGDDVLLIRRGRAPRAGSWSLPGGGQRLSEGAEACARREVLEETGIKIGALHLVAVIDAITPGGPGLGPRFHYTIIDYAAHWVSGTPSAGGDVTEAVWARDLAPYALTSEALEVIARARAMLSAAAAG